MLASLAHRSLRIPTPRLGDATPSLVVAVLVALVGVGWYCAVLLNRPGLAVLVTGGALFASLRLPSWVGPASVPLLIPFGLAAVPTIGSVSVPITYADLGIALALAQYVNRHTATRVPYKKWLVALVAWNWIAVAFAAHLPFALSGVKTVTFAAVLSVITYSVCADTARDRRYVIISVVLGSSMLAVKVLSQVLLTRGTVDTGVVDKSLSDLDFGRSNYLAALLVLGVTMAFIAIPLVSAKGRFAILVGALPLQLAAIVATGSRGQTAAAALAVVCGVWLISGREASLPKAAPALVVAGGGLIVVTLWNRILEIWQPAIDYGVRDYSSVTARFAIWRAAWRQFTSSPVVGVGQQNLEWEGSYVMAHNWAIQVLAETGVVGASLFICALGAQWLLARGLARRAASVLLLVTAVSGFVEPTLRTREYDYLFWCALAAVVAGGGALKAESDLRPNGGRVASVRGTVSTASLSAPRAHR